MRYEVNLKLTKEEHDILIKGANILHYFLSMFDITYESSVSQDVYDKIVSNTRFDRIDVE